LDRVQRGDVEVDYVCHCGLIGEGVGEVSLEQSGNGAIGVVSIKDNNLEERVRPGPMLYTFNHHGSGKGVITIENEVEVCRLN
jgi:hypothetical protein